MMGGGEDVEFKTHGYENEATIGGADECTLKRVKHRPNLYILDFSCGDRLKVSGDPRSDHIAITFNWGAKS